jgi:hypothetical protein
MKSTADVVTKVKYILLILAVFSDSLKVSEESHHIVCHLLFPKRPRTERYLPVLPSPSHEGRFVDSVGCRILYMKREVCSTCKHHRLLVLPQAKTAPAGTDSRFYT